ncbi:flagellar biosynthesis protein FlgD [Pokkaliibacter plantistimulans]|uniref:Basal-body rod modification protein FlgD n=1 Tax=Proteobacteria bacterium 228 TaxID=2083153 RepID=A0A2S5KUQ2_9PROT|nr:flagellar hook capping FlgD N-terminal domain-containing protein [Pokkaliibacter plantistimulans]PPC78468.1 flagellar biosynthesis protein FlgD [Pokkaliibacter plantistimulans]
MSSSGVSGLGNSLSTTSSTSTSSSSDTSLDSDMFMQLMIAQLKNQDPTSPTDTSEYMSQLASLSTVEQLTNLNDSVSELQTSLQSNLALQASSMVGRTAYVESDSADLDTAGGTVQGMLDLDSSASDVSVGVYNSSGVQVDTIDLGNLSSGENAFTWSPSTSIAGGTYYFVAQGTVGSTSTSLTTYMGQNVDSVSISDGSMTLNLGNGDTASMSDIKRIS